MSGQMQNIFPRTFRRGDFPGAPCISPVPEPSCTFHVTTWTQHGNLTFFFSPRVLNLLSFLMPCKLLPVTISSLLPVSHYYFILSFSSFPFLPWLFFFFSFMMFFPLSRLFIYNDQWERYGQAGQKSQLSCGETAPKEPIGPFRVTCC